jgi:hypothetical protein
VESGPLRAANGDQHMITIIMKRGETFTFARNMADDGMSGSIDDYTIRSQLRQDDILIDDLTITADEDQEEHPGDFVITSKDFTDEWPLGRCLFDIEYNKKTGNTFKKSETFQVYVLSSPTYPPEN